MKTYEIKCAIIRGGTTKGIFLDSSLLPQDECKRDNLLLSLFGSPDTQQINGLGGGDPLTSKVALIRRSTDKNADIDYQSGEVGIDEASINYSTMCGNLASGAGLFALDIGWITKTSPVTNIKIRNLNTGKYLEASIRVDDDVPNMARCQDIDGVMGYGTEINLTFKRPSGSITGKLLPTGSPVDIITIGTDTFSCSIIDCGTLYVFINAKAFNLKGNELPEVLDNQVDFKNTIELIRAEVAKKISDKNANKYTAKQIKVAIFAFPGANEQKYDIIARVINRYKTHKAYPVTGAICISAATMITGSILYKADGVESNHQIIRISHPSGLISTETVVEIISNNVSIVSTAINRTANILLKGEAKVVVSM